MSLSRGCDFGGGVDFNHKCIYICIYILNSEVFSRWFYVFMITAQPAATFHPFPFRRFADYTARTSGHEIHQ